MTPEFSHIINGKAQAAAAHFNVLNPSTGGVVGKAPRATAADVDAAIAAAKAAFPIGRAAQTTSVRRRCALWPRLLRTTPKNWRGY